MHFVYAKIDNFNIPIQQERNIKNSVELKYLTIKYLRGDACMAGKAGITPQLANNQLVRLNGKPRTLSIPGKLEPPAGLEHHVQRCLRVNSHLLVVQVLFLEVCSPKPCVCVVHSIKQIVHMQA